MYYNNGCGDYCEPRVISNKDRKALLQEQEAILEAKLATVRHWIESADEEESESEKK